MKIWLLNSSEDNLSISQLLIVRLSRAFGQGFKSGKSYLFLVTLFDVYEKADHIPEQFQAC